MMRKVVLLMRFRSAAMMVLLSLTIGLWTGSPCCAQAQKDAAKKEIYDNKEFCFRMALPASWKGYTVETEKERNKDDKGQIQEWTEITIHHPETNQPFVILIVTKKQWKLIEREKLFVDAAPFTPNFLGSNRHYVFAISERWEIAADLSPEETAEFMDGRPFHAY